ncbi:hypothetical protein ACIQF6_02195 [Kitasatospora sp. NPDC092948]|uniref:hypothetical protein n=1 Tax=Kitasatospora sp. NPDC092948 TaxID=3364088 RepID=UPI00382FE0D9
MRLRKLIAAAGVATTVAGFGLVSAGQASAFDADCAGNTHAVCLYYNTSANGYGAYFKQTADTPDYGNSVFTAGLNGTAGAGALVWNHVKSVNSWYGGTFVIYFGSGAYNCSVGCMSVAPWATVDVNLPMNSTISTRFS